MAHWARPTGGTNDIAIFTSRNGGLDWEEDTRTAEPGFSGFMQMKRSPDGAYLAYSICPRLVVWRAEAAGGQFRKVYEQPGEDIPETTGAGSVDAGRPGLRERERHGRRLRRRRPDLDDRPDVALS